jgi:heme oxygenase
VLVSQLLEKIRQKTLVAHEELETTLRLFERCTTRDGYVAVLKKFFGFYSPLSDHLSWLGLKEDAERVGLRAKWLYEDFKSLGVSTEQIALIPLCEDLPRFRDADEVLGFTYVLEGSTLGGQVISRHFRKLWEQDDNAGLGFFGAYGVETGPKWRSFTQDLKRRSFGLSESQQEAVVNGAHMTFQKLQKWMMSG